MASILLIAWRSQGLRLPSLIPLGISWGLAIAYTAGWQHPLIVWSGLVFFLVALLLLDSEFDSSAIETTRHRVMSWALVTGLATAGSLLPTLLEQERTRFSAEEFFVLERAVILWLICLLLLAIFRFARRHTNVGRALASRYVAWRTASATLLFLLASGGIVHGAIAYQHSFYPPTAPAFDAISATHPFLCGKLSQKDASPPETDIFPRIIRAVAANPQKGVPEYGMLALATHENQWAQQFRQALLAEAAKKRFTAPSNSVKSTQYEAALRVYYSMRVRDAFPNLFSEDDVANLRAWYADVNRRALTTEWVDWMYGLAFSKWPEGPYENQENGAGLLALLEVSGLRPDDLSPANRAYLQRNRRGWQTRFRNTDDAYIYEQEWITNAYFQSLYYGAPNVQHIQQSFRWLLLQALPDGNRFGYNHPARPNLAALFYWGAGLLHDPALLWAAGQEIANLEDNGEYLPAQPGAELPVTASETMPTDGTCLLYGDSGLPNQRGPLAPDKIVFRDAWNRTGWYALLNLRFTGWHRYKATNALVLLYGDQTPLVTEQTQQPPISWLPVGRSLFRDKRIPRESLNGLLVPASNLSDALRTLTGIGSVWAQDPPYYASVESFATLGPLDVSRTRLANWHGWSQSRTIYFFHGGPFIVVDHATNDSHQGYATIVWHVRGKGQRRNSALILGSESQAPRLLLSDEAWRTTNISPVVSGGPPDPFAPAQTVRFRSPQQGALDLVSTFAGSVWQTANYLAEPVGGQNSKVVGQYISLANDSTQITLLHNEGAAPLTSHGLATDGQFLSKRETTFGPVTLCYKGGTTIEVPVRDKVNRVQDVESKRLLVPGSMWVWAHGRLVLHPANSEKARCVTVE
ncbi:MAG: hypothetical protein GXP41_06125 [Chloroflexi bacterium]|nr:hypothetical protein [Chloroflexota bacterium]